MQLQGVIMKKNKFLFFILIFICISLFLLLLFMVDPENSTEEISESVECIEE